MAAENRVMTPHMKLPSISNTVEQHVSRLDGMVSPLLMHNICLLHAWVMLVPVGRSMPPRQVVLVKVCPSTNGVLLGYTQSCVVRRPA